MNLWVILLAACLVIALGAGGALLSVATNAMLHGRSAADEVGLNNLKAHARIAHDLRRDRGGIGS